MQHPTTTVRRQQQVHANGSIRHAEKRRSGSCHFANRIARISLDAYDATVPLSYRDAHRSGTCVASIVAHFRGGEDDRGRRGSSTAEGAEEKEAEGEEAGCRLQVMGLGVGTKFLSDAILLRDEEEKEEDEMEEDGSSSGLGDRNSGSGSNRLRNDRRNRGCYGARIRDCHAEILARRAFVRRISMEMLMSRDENDENDENDGDGGSSSDDYVPILERDEDSRSRSRRYRLKDGVTLHLYASSAPCGNATLKKFAKMEREIFDTSLGPDEWPMRPHEPIPAHSLRLGQFALLVKRNGSTSMSLSSSSRRPEVGERDDVIADGTSTMTTGRRRGEGLPEKKDEEEEEEVEEVEEEGDRRRWRRPWPCREYDDWCPPSCSIPNFGVGTIHSCSDKICRWNCLGLQGSLLMSVLDEPMYMSTLTVGRKFNRAICQRAVCCRADGFGSRGRRGGRRRRRGGNDEDDDDENDDAANDLGKYKLNHPTLMETNVYMDEAGTHDMSGVTSLGRDATFDSNICWTWWPGKGPNGLGYAADCLETGLVIDYNNRRGDGDESDGRDDDDKRISEASTLALIRIHAEILRRVGYPRDDMGTTTSSSELTLSDVRRLKRRVSPHHESVKDEFLRHRVFDQWSRRGCQC